MQASNKPRRTLIRQSCQKVWANEVPIDVNDHAIAANVSNNLRDMLSARMPVNSTAVAKKTVKVAPASNEYFSVVKF